MADERTIEDRQSEMKLKLAETLMKTIPEIPDDFHQRSADEQEKIFTMIDQRSDKIMSLLGAHKGRGPTKNPRGPRRSERFNTPELDTTIRKKKKHSVEDD